MNERSKPTFHRFDGRADMYAKYRPHYPPSMIGLLVKEIGFSFKTSVADIASGTGILSELFLSTGTPCIASNQTQT